MLFRSGLAAIIGHGRSIWLRFAGGKSAGNGVGCARRNSLAGRVACGVGVGAVLANFRIVSLSSIAAALATIALMLTFRQPLPHCLLAAAGGLYLILTQTFNA